MAVRERSKSDVEARSTAADSSREQVPGSEAGTLEAPTEEGVARRAYEIYERRGGGNGHDWDDWFQAEEEIRGLEKV